MVILKFFCLARAIYYCLIPITLLVRLDLPLQPVISQKNTDIVSPRLFIFHIHRFGLSHFSLGGFDVKLGLQAGIQFFGEKILKFERLRSMTTRKLFQADILDSLKRKD